MNPSDPPAVPATDSPVPARRDPLEIARQLQSEAGAGRLPPVHLWHPPLSGDIDMEIRRDGRWFHEGTPISRAPLVKLFSSILRREDDGFHYLVTPVEKWRLRVEDAPFVITTVERLAREGGDYLQMTTQTGDVLVAGDEHPIRLAYRGDEPAPYVLVRDRLEALIGRNAYYELVGWGHARAGADGRDELVVASAGREFVIGHF